MINKKDVQGLIFYFENSAELDPGIQEKTLCILDAFLEEREAAEAAANKKRKSPNKSGILQIDPETGKIVNEYATQKEAYIAIGKEGKSGIGDALNGRTKTHMAYSYKWYFKNEYDQYLAEQAQ